jgi:Holliday junction DNA helicase RuvA
LIAQLRGTVLRRLPPQVVLDVSGVGYDVHVPLSTYYRLDEGALATLRIHTHVREDALQLFGFLTEQEQALFLLLIDVSGVGPRLALNILSGIEADDLSRALADGDAVRLTRVPGVGRKTADRLIVELREKVQPLVAGTSAPAGGKGAHAHEEDLLSALAHLGYGRAEAKKAVTAAVRAEPEAAFEHLLRSALSALAKG